MVSQTQTAVAPPEGAPDAGVPWHFGDPLGEQRLLDSGQGFVDLSHRPVIEVAGDDRLTWLHTLTSQHVSELPSGEWTQALILDANGRVEHHLDLVDDGERVLAHVEPGTADALMEYLQKMVFWSKVELRVRDDLGVVWRPGAAGMDGSDAFTFRAARRRCCAGRAGCRDVGVRGAARCRRTPEARLRHRPPHDPARGELDRRRRSPGEGLLPRTGDRGAGAQPR